MTPWAVTWLSLALRLAVLLLFPWLAIQAWRAGGAARLGWTTGLAIGLVLVFGVLVATPIGGNVLAQSHGYGYTVPASLVLHGLTLGAPLGATGLAVRALGPRRWSRPALYAIGVLVAGAAWVAGIVAAVGIVFSVR